MGFRRSLGILGLMFFNRRREEYLLKLLLINSQIRLQSKWESSQIWVGYTFIGKSVCFQVCRSRYIHGEGVFASATRSIPPISSLNRILIESNPANSCTRRVSEWNKSDGANISKLPIKKHHWNESMRE